MKTIKLIITGVFFFILSFSIQAQPDPPPHGEETDQEPGGNAPLSGGLFILIGLGVAYGGKKVYNLKKNPEV